MTVFNAFLKVLKKNLVTVIVYTVIFVVFAGINTSTSETSSDFVSTKHDIYVINNDKGSAISDNLEKYLSENTNVVDIKDDEESIKDALFYRRIVYVVEIPNGYGDSVLHGNALSVETRKTESYSSALVDMMLKRYLRVQTASASMYDEEDIVIHTINSTLEESTEVEMISALDTNSLSKVRGFFDFSAYSVTACIVFIICIVLSSFNDINIRKRTVIGSISAEKYTLLLMISCCTYALVVWLFFTGLVIGMSGTVMLTPRGGIYIMNLFIFSMTVLSMAYFLASIITNKDAVNGIVNVIALGSAFLCGAFVPREYLPDFVLKIAHILPAYWFIDSNDRLAEIETVTLDSLVPVFINMAVMFGFIVVFITVSVIINKKKQKIS